MSENVPGSSERLEILQLISSLISNVEQVALESVGACDKQVLSVRHYVNSTEHSPKSKCLNTNTCFFGTLF